MLFRWSRVGEEMVWISAGSMGFSAKTIISMSAEGGLTYVTDSGPDKNKIVKFTVEADGSVYFPPNKKHTMRMRLSNGNLVYDLRENSAGEWKEVSNYLDVANAQPKAKEIAEKRRLKFGLVAAAPRQVATPSVARVQVTQSAPPAVISTSTQPKPVETSNVALASTGPRLALVIGNSRYGPALGALPNPVNDAATMTQALRSVGFQVEIVTDADQKTIKRAIARFGERLRASGRGSTGLFFYAGHGIQSRGTNYLIPIGAAIEAEADVDLESVAADTVLLQMEEAGSSTNIVILDACRNMPLSRSFRSGARGLARMEAPNGSFVAYSTAPGSVAADGEGKNSPFVTALAQQISRKGQPIEVVFRDVRRTVLESTGGRQTPWDSSSLISPFFFSE